MTWVGHSWGVIHAAAEAGVSALSAGHTMATQFPLSHLIDYQSGKLARPAASETDAEYDLDRGAGVLSGLSHVVIPPVHNLDGATTITLESDDNAGFTSPTSRASISPPADGNTTIWSALTGAPVTERYWRLTIEGSGIFEFGDWWLTAIVTPASGWEPGYRDTPEFEGVRVDGPSGPWTVISDLPRRRIRGRNPFVDVAGDITALRAVLAALNGQGRVLYFPPDDGDAPIIVAGRARQVKQDHPRPSGAGEAWGFEWDLEEVR